MAFLLQTRCKLRDLAGLRRVVVKGGPKRVTRSVRAKVMRLKEWIGKEGFVVEMEGGVREEQLRAGCCGTWLLET